MSEKLNQALPEINRQLPGWAVGHAHSPSPAALLQSEAKLLPLPAPARRKSAASQWSWLWQFAYKSEGAEGMESAECAGCLGTSPSGQVVAGWKETEPQARLRGSAPAWPLRAGPPALYFLGHGITGFRFFLSPHFSFILLERKAPSRRLLA